MNHEIHEKHEKHDHPFFPVRPFRVFRGSFEKIKRGDLTTKDTNHTKARQAVRAPTPAVSRTRFLTALLVCFVVHPYRAKRSISDLG